MLVDKKRLNTFYATKRQDEAKEGEVRKRQSGEVEKNHPRASSSNLRVYQEKKKSSVISPKSGVSSRHPHSELDNQIRQININKNFLYKKMLF